MARAMVAWRQRGPRLAQVGEDARMPHARALPLAAAALCALAAAAPPVGGQSADAARVVSTVAGDGRAGESGDGGPAIAARLRGPRDVAALPGGGLLIADTGNDRVRRVDAAGRIATVAGDGPVRLSEPQGVAPLPGGGLLIADTGNHVVRRVAPSGETTTVAGREGRAGLAGDGGPAREALLDRPAAVAPLADGAFLIADTGNGRVRRVGPDGAIATVADGLSEPVDVAALTDGLVVAAQGDGTVRRVAGDGPATVLAGRLQAPSGVAVGAGGEVLVAEARGNRVSAIEPGGAVRTVVGTGSAGFGGDGGPPLEASLSGPSAVALDGDRLLIADTFNERVRAVGAAPQPAVGRTAVAATVTGAVRVRLPGARGFEALGSVRALPLGSELDARSGAVRVRFATAPGLEASAVASAGRFVLGQPRRRVGGQRAGDLRLSGPLAGCGAEATGGRGRARRLQVHAEGTVRTTGLLGSATVRGTRWTMTDRCRRGGRASTAIRVAEGTVAARDRVRGRTVLVRAGERYVARAPH
jgi:sugar lactone lactonase YvrE